MGAWRTRKVRGRLMSQDRKNRNSLLLLPATAAAALVRLMAAVAAAMDGEAAGWRVSRGGEFTIRGAPASSLRSTRRSGRRGGGGVRGGAPRLDSTRR
jgi:hypothetical protein